MRESRGKAAYTETHLKRNAVDLNPVFEPSKPNSFTRRCDVRCEQKSDLWQGFISTLAQSKQK